MGCTLTKTGGEGWELDDITKQLFVAAGTGDTGKLNEIVYSLKKSPVQLKNLLNTGLKEADNLTPLSIAAGKKHKVFVEQLIEMNNVDVNKPSDSGITPLLMVAEVGWPDVLEKLINKGAKVHVAPTGIRAEEAKIAGSTPLIGATKYNHPQCLQILLKNRANPNHQNQSGISALMLAAEQGYGSCVQALVDHGAHLELAPQGDTALSMNLSGQTPLFCAAKEGHVSIVKYLLVKGANPNARNHYGISVLWIPSQKGYDSVVELLLEHDADTELAPKGKEAEDRGIAGWTPLYAAMKSRQSSTVKLLLKHGADPNAITKLGSSPFLLASEVGDIDVVKAFVEKNADLNYCPYGPASDELKITGQTAIFMAALKERLDVVEYLLKKGAHANIRNMFGVSPLLLAAESGNLALVTLLIDHGHADTNISPHGKLANETLLAGQTPLYAAAKKNHVKCAQKLVEHGAQVDICTLSGSSPLLVAVEEGNLEMVEYLVKIADISFVPSCKKYVDSLPLKPGQQPEGVNIPDQEGLGHSALLLACIKNYTEIIHCILRYGKRDDTNYSNSRGFTPFLAACQHNNVEIVHALLDCMADPRAVATNLFNCKINALIITAETGSLELTKLLVEQFEFDINYRIQGDPSADTCGRTPLFCACAKGHTQIVKYLVGKGADVNATEESGISCLHIASIMGHVDVTKILCSNPNININQTMQLPDDGGEVTALDLASSQYHKEVSQVLRDHGAVLPSSIDPNNTQLSSTTSPNNQSTNPNSDKNTSLINSTSQQPQMSITSSDTSRKVLNENHLHTPKQLVQ
ncbi:hypothetical protein SNEBB_011137 [Seison nebaliae]|nr:hypothetical protein SNEBB_011137 [Seison nebaliae]